MFSTEPVLSEKHFLDEKVMLSNSDFPIKQEDLIEKCKVSTQNTIDNISSNFAFL